MLVIYPRRVTVKNKGLISKHIKSEKNMHIYKSHGIIKNYKSENTVIALDPSSYVFIKSTCIQFKDRNVFARFDEIPLMTLLRY